MNRYLLPLMMFLVTAAVWAQSSPAPTVTDKAERLKGNRALVEVLVNGSLSLAAAESPIQRAEECSGIAEELAEVIRDAADANQRYRAAEIGTHLGELLKYGVARNLKSFGEQLPTNSAGIQEMQAVQNRVAKLTRSVDRQLQSSPEALGAVQAGWQEVEKAMKSKKADLVW